MAQIQVRIDDVLKAQAQEVLEQLGLNLSTAIKMLCTQIVQRQALPLESVDVNGFSKAKQKRLDDSVAEIEQGMKDGTLKYFTSAEDMMDDILSEK